MRWLFGDDIVISYARSDGTDYALKLASCLTALGYSCFLDQMETKSDKQVPRVVLNRFQNGTMLVLVASEKAASSEAIKKELEEFRKTKRTITVIDAGGFGEHALWWADTEGLPPTKEVGDIPSCEPSQNVVDRIHASFTYTRRNQRLRQIASYTAIVVAALLLGGFLAGWFVTRQLQSQVDTMKEQVRTTQLLSKIPFRAMPGKYSARQLEIIYLDRKITTKHLARLEIEKEAGLVSRQPILVAKIRLALIAAEIDWAARRTNSAYQKLLELVKLHKEYVDCTIELSLEPPGPGGRRRPRSETRYSPITAAEQLYRSLATLLVVGEYLKKNPPIPESLRSQLEQPLQIPAQQPKLDSLPPLIAPEILSPTEKTQNAPAP